MSYLTIMIDKSQYVSYKSEAKIQRARIGEILMRCLGYSQKEWDSDAGSEIVTYMRWASHHSWCMAYYLYPKKGRAGAGLQGNRCEVEHKQQGVARGWDDPHNAS
jgi:hypothetical protein